MTSPYINRFLQPDSIIPDQTNPQSWNRFSYVGNNPTGYTDPSGHCRIDDDPEDCLLPDKSNAGNSTPPNPPGGGGGCQRNCDPDIERQDELFSLMFIGSGDNGVWTSDDWIYYYAHRNELWNNPAAWLYPDKEAGWDLFALHVERLAAHYSEDQHEQFVRDFGLVFAGLSTTVHWWKTAMDARDGAGEYIYLNEGNAGLPEKYHDDVHLGENESHHYAGLFFLGYFTNGHMAAAVNIARDGDFWNGEFNSGDIILGDAAAYDGGNFGNPFGNSTLADVSVWIDELSP